MNIIFCGSPEFAIPSLQALASKHTIMAVITQPDKPQGRGLKVQESAIATYAHTLGLPVLKPERLRDIKTLLLSLQVDIIVVVAYGKMIPDWLLHHPTFGCINVHASLLPQYRGASPIHYAMIHGENITGISIMQLEKGMDTGGYWLQKTCAITDDITIQELHDILAASGAAGLCEVLDQELYRIAPIAQPNIGITYAPKLTAADFSYHPAFTAHDIKRRLHAFSPKGLRATIAGHTIKIIKSGPIILCAHSHHPGLLIKIDDDGLWITTTDGMIAITTIQLASHKIQEIQSIRYGLPQALQLGQQLEPPSL